MIFPVKEQVLKAFKRSFSHWKQFSRIFTKMNVSDNQTITPRTFYFDLDTVFNLLGSVLTFDYIQLYFVTPVMIIGAILEILLIYIFNQKVFAAKLYFYLKFYCLNAALLNVIAIAEPIIGAKRLVPFGISESGVKYNCFFYVPLSSIFYSVSNIMDLVIQIEKLKTFVKSMKFIDRFAPFKICLAVVVFSIVYQIPLYGQYTYEKIPFPIGPVPGDYFYVFVISPYEWTKHPVANMMLIAIYFVQEVVTLVLNLIFGVMLWISFRKYSKKRQEMLKGKASNQTKATAQTVEAQNRNTATSRAEIKTTAMVLCFGIISIFKNIPILAIITWGHLNTINTAAFVIAVQVAQYIVNLNNVFHIVVYYIFDKNFEQEVKRILSLKWIKPQAEVSAQTAASMVK